MTTPVNPAIESMLKFFLYGPGHRDGGGAAMPDELPAAELPDAKKKMKFQDDYSSSMGKAPFVDGIPGAALDG